jgi:transcriptional regulator with XRE-family HTH domain
MIRRHLSQNALAKAAGMPATLVHRAMSGERVFTIDEVDAVAGVLGVKPEQLIRAARERIERTPPSGDVQI